jgi:hypothetical protein
VKLELHLIPESTFYGNLRNKIGRQKWTTLSKKIRKGRDYTSLNSNTFDFAASVVELYRSWRNDFEK